MKSIKDKFKKVNPKYTAYALFVVPVVIVVLFVVFVFGPYKTKIDKLTEDIGKNQSEISSSLLMERKLEQLKTANNKLQADLVTAARVLPPSGAAEALPDMISGLAQENRLQIRSATPGKKTVGPNNVYEEMPITFDLSGSYHDVAKLIEKVDTLTQLSTMSELQMSSARMEGVRMIIPVKFTLVAFTAAASGGK